MGNNPWELFGKYMSGNLSVGGKKLNPWNPLETVQTINGYKEQQETPKTSVDAQLSQAQNRVSTTQNLQNQARQQTAAKTVLNSAQSWNPVDRITSSVQALGELMNGKTQYDDTLQQQQGEVQNLASQQYNERVKSKVRRWDGEPLMQNAPRTSDTMQEKLMQTATYDDAAQTLRKGTGNTDALWAAGLADNLRYAMMTEDEKARYYSIKSTSGQDTANKYLEDINPYLNARFSQLYGKAGKDNALLSTAGGLLGGVESFGTGMKQLGSRVMGYQNPVEEMTLEQADRDLAPQLTGWQSTLRNVANAAGYAMPAVAVTIATGGAGAAPMAAVMAGGALTAMSTWGNDYRLDRSLGYTDAQAATHATADAAIQFAINSIPGGLTGKGLGVVAKLLSKAPVVDEAVALFSKSPVVVKLFGKVAETYGREVAENVMQGAASEAIRNASLGGNNALFTQEGFKQALEGAFVSHLYRAPEYARAVAETAAAKGEGPAGVRAESEPRMMTMQEAADALQRRQNVKAADAGSQDSTHMLTNPDGTLSPAKMTLNADRSAYVRDAGGNEWTMSFKQLMDDVAAGKVNRIEDSTAGTHTVSEPNGARTNVQIIRNADGTATVRDQAGNAEVVHPQLLPLLMQAGVVSKIPKTLEEFMATQPTFEELNRQALHDVIMGPVNQRTQEIQRQQAFSKEMDGHLQNALTKMMEPHATRQAEALLQQMQAEKQAGAEVPQDGKLAAEVVPDEGAPLQTEKQAEVENTSRDDTIERIVNKTGIPKTKIIEIIKTKKGSRPEPKTYLSKDYIAKHLAKFKDGVAKIVAQAPVGPAGPPNGTFVMPSSVADDIIARAGGDVTKLEILLGFPKGALGANPVRINIAHPTGLRIPSGNELGANLKWIPGGYTSGGLIEAIIDPPISGQYTVAQVI